MRSNYSTFSDFNFHQVLIFLFSAQHTWIEALPTRRRCRCATVEVIHAARECLSNVLLEMGGGRNGRFLRWGFVLLVFLTMVYVFYLYRDIKGVLRDREDALENMNTLHTRMTEELKGV